MTQNQNSKPVETIRDGAIKVSIWKNQGEKGPFCSVKITRTYTDDSGNYHDSDSFSGSELLKVSRLAGKAYDRAFELRAAEPKQEAA